MAYVLNKYVTKKNEREFMGLEVREEVASEALADPQGVSAEEEGEASTYEAGREYLTDEELAEMGVLEEEGKE